MRASALSAPRGLERPGCGPYVGGMDLQLFATVFASVFLAELGDKTQLATLLFAAEADNPKLTVFVASAMALVLTSAIGVLAGATLLQIVNPRALSIVAGLGFVAIGLWTVLRAWSGA
jgi:putative Ca2+/H+ antiporter (TMEM165/GDT1 family)